jgi:hypothetical protein
MVQPSSKGYRAGLADVKEMRFDSPHHDHPAGRLLDTLFRRFSVIDNEAAFLEAGFKIRATRKRTFMRVATHPTLAGYVFKVFFVEEQSREREKSSGWANLAARCKQAERIRRIIRKHAFQHFRVPQKWLFPTPPHPACGPDNQPTILVAEFQDLVPQDENEHAWRHSITEDHLHELYAILEGAGGVSSRPDNIALTRQGWFAFIDTEYSHYFHDYESIAPYLSRRMRQYWSGLMRAAGSEAMAP